MIHSRAWGVVVSAVVLLAVAEPLRRDPDHDGFPLSTYPMFSRNKSGRARLRHVVAFSREGRHRVLRPELLGNDEVMQAVATADLAVRQGRAQQLCEEAAAAVAGSPDHRDVEFLEVRTDVFDSVKYFQGDRRPIRTRVHARCEVESR